MVFLNLYKKALKTGQLFPLTLKILGNYLRRFVIKNLWANLIAKGAGDQQILIGVFF